MSFHESQGDFGWLLDQMLHTIGPRKATHCEEIPHSKTLIFALIVCERKYLLAMGDVFRDTKINVIV